MPFPHRDNFAIIFFLCLFFSRKNVPKYYKYWYSISYFQALFWAWCSDKPFNTHEQTSAVGTAIPIKQRNWGIVRLDNLNLGNGAELLPPQLNCVALW